VTTGEGGMLTTADEEFAELMKSLRSHGVDRSASVRHAQGLAPANAQYVRVGYTYRLSDVQSAIGRVQLRKLAAFVSERNAMARLYDDAFAELAGFRLPARRSDWTHSYQSYVIVLEKDAPIEPDAFMGRLAERGISTRVGTYAVHRQPYFSGGSDALLPHSSLAADRSVAIPLFNGLAPNDQKRVIDTVREVWEESGATR
jgi:dTDP-4-amino-4,6-dideoxygalactose transaminase